MLNAVTIAAIVAAVWAHPMGVAYLAKIDAIQEAVESCGNPCCLKGKLRRHVSGGPREYYDELDMAFVIAIIATEA